MKSLPVICHHKVWPLSLRTCCCKTDMSACRFRRGVAAVARGFYFQMKGGMVETPPADCCFAFYVQACKKRGTCLLLNRTTLWLCSRVEGPPAFILKSVSFHLSRSKSSSSVRTLRQLQRTNVSSWNRPQTHMYVLKKPRLSGAGHRSFHQLRFAPFRRPLW